MSIDENGKFFNSKESLKISDFDIYSTLGNFLRFQ